MDIEFLGYPVGLGFLGDLVADSQLKSFEEGIFGYQVCFDRAAGTSRRTVGV